MTVNADSVQSLICGLVVGAIVFLAAYAFGRGRKR